MSELENTAAQNSDEKTIYTERSLAEIIDLPEGLQAIIQVVMRNREATLAEISEQLNQPQRAVAESLKDLVEQGFLQTITSEQEIYYRLNVIARKSQKLSDQIWNQLE
ncbi:MAG TPA: MarR family transcriptional regulator [Leptolyngbyaceae cyanobacterium M33_DOE_097]|uniref:MarR family transcriptional regulator n=1 Tax=Oscillatoriales cyanobacterium SpSt-418 TaxID=2282169 RepID=A0A7C3PF83_9CYAN|nr:MarR family transcriptional regulator [Leptolyngbyaceae cyanobacterium M33_DOE_097]